jgi:hypothetical protein
MVAIKTDEPMCSLKSRPLIQRWTVERCSSVAAGTGEIGVTDGAMADGKKGSNLLYTPQNVERLLPT